MNTTSSCLTDLIKKKIHKGKTSNWSKEIIIYTDGASRGNPGPASAGIVVYNTDELCIYEEAFLLKEQSNNFAEYSAVLRALQISVENKINTLTLNSDSELLIKQLSGVYKVKSANIKTLYEECKNQESKIPQVNFQHVRRENNKRADELANLILDGFDSII